MNMRSVIITTERGVWLASSKVGLVLVLPSIRTLLILQCMSAGVRTISVLFDGLKTMTSIYQWGRTRKKVTAFQKRPARCIIIQHWDSEKIVHLFMST